MVIKLTLLHPTNESLEIQTEDPVCRGSRQKTYFRVSFRVPGTSAILNHDTSADPGNKFDKQNAKWRIDHQGLTFICWYFNDPSEV